MVTMEKLKAMQLQLLGLLVAASQTVLASDPHTDPRAIEICFLVSRTVDVGVVDTSNLFQFAMQAGQLFVFPKGLLHFRRNNQKYGASGFSSLSSEKPGMLVVTNALFIASGTGPLDSVLETALSSTSAYNVGGIKMAPGSYSSA